MMSFFIGEDGLQNIYLSAIPLHASVILSEMIYGHISESKLYSGKDLIQNIFWL